jgi:hypothetical protein
MKLTTSSTSDVIIDQFTSLTGGCRVNIAGGSNTTFQFSIGAAGANIACTIASSVTTGVWQHWLIAYDGSQTTNATRLKIFKDGAAQTVSFSGTVPATIAASGASFILGFSAAALDGSLADVMWWSGVTPEGLAASQCNSYRPVWDGGMSFDRFWAPLDDGVSASDYSGRGRSALSVTATKSPDSPGVGLGHPEMVIE